MPFPSLLLAGAASAMTFLGGALALRFRHRLGGITALAAGAVTGVALFDLLPESLEIGRDRPGPIILIALLAAGVPAYRLATRAVSGRAGRPARLGPAILTCHSLLDGIGIGVAFSHSPSTGLLVALAVLTHDLADGANTIGLSLGGGSPRLAWRWLLLNAAAPIAGAIIGGMLHPADGVFSALLAVMAGLFLAIGLTELAPRSLALRPRASTGLLGLAGATLIWGIGRLGG